VRSINIYDLTISEGIGQIQAFNDTEQVIINDFDETLTTTLSTNPITADGYRSFSILTDKVYDMSVRVRGVFVHNVIKQEIYQAFFKETNQRPNGIGALVTLCKSEDSLKVKNVLERRFGMNFNRHTFNILSIIEQASDVRNARFNVAIETVDSISMRGTRVNDTQYYARMLRSGQLKAVIITFDMPAQTVTFRISVDGKILLYNDLSESEILNLIDQILDIEENN